MRHRTQHNCSLPAAAGLLLLIATVNMAAADMNPGVADLVLVDSGSAKAVIVRPADPAPPITRAADELQRRIAEMTGAELAVISADQVGDHTAAIRIHVGVNKTLTDGLPDLSACQIDGAWTVVLSPRDLLIAGNTAVGTEYGVYGFLQDFCGVRWFLPGDSGTYVPSQATLAIPGDTARLDNPFFASRMYSAPTFWGSKQLPEAAVQMDMAWFRHNRMRNNHQIHHNLWRVIPPATYGKEHPEYFPDKDGNGKRYIPPLKGAKMQIGWQPCMSNPDVIELAAAAAIDFFDKNPTKQTFSLGVNDHCGFCRCKPCLEVNGGGARLGSNGLLSYSNLYFAFVNKVAARVAEKYPDRYLGCLAYAWVHDYPDFAIHPQVAIMYTMNTDGAFDTVTARDMIQVNKYADACGMFGVYTYLYGMNYKIPVMWTGLLDEFLDKLAAKNAKWFYAETYHNWGMDGIKYYLLSQKLWDPSASFSAMLEEFCETMFDAGSDDLKAFFEFCRDRWENQPFTNIGSYSSLVGSSQRVLFDAASCTDLLQLLHSGREKTQSEKGRTLCDMFVMNIEHCRALAELQERKLKLLGTEVITPQDVLDVYAAGRLVRAARERLAESPFCMTRKAAARAKKATSPKAAAKIDGNAVLAAPFLQQCSREENGEQELAALLEQVAVDAPGLATGIRLLDDFFDREPQLPELLQNASFEELDRDRRTAKGWKAGTWAGKGPVENVFVVPQAASGAFCYYFNGIKHTLGYYPRPMIEMTEPASIQGGRQYMLKARVKFTADPVAGVFPQPSVYIVFTDKNNKPAGTKRLSGLPGTAWFDARWVFDAPAKAATIKITFLPLQGIGEAWIDDVSLKMVPAPE
jgi:hypothetical protein